MDTLAPTRETKLSPAIEDYVKAIYLLHQEHAQVATSLVAKQVGVSPAAVSGMIQKLAKLNLITHIPYHGMVLTDLGQRTALKVLRRHHLLKRFLVEALEYSWDGAQVEADVLEHVISEMLEARIAQWLGQHSAKPHRSGGVVFATCPVRDGAQEDTALLSDDSLKRKTMPDQPAPQPHVLDDPPPFHSKLLGYGERPSWSPDGTRIAFIERNYGDVCEIDLDTRTVRNLTHGLGEHHAFLRVLYLHNGDYLLIGPKAFKHRDISRHVESELWVMDHAAQTPPVPLGRRIFEGAAVSTLALRIAYAVTGRNDPSLGAADTVECHVTDIVYGPDGPRLGADQIIYRTAGGYLAEPQDFRHQDSEVIMAEYDFRREIHPDTQRCIVKGVEIATGKVRTYINEPHVHNECEGIFPDGEHCCLESSCDMEPHGNYTIKTRDLWKLKLDGSGRRVRMTHFYDRPPRIVASPNAPIGPWHTAPWLATNGNVSPDGRWLVFMVNLLHDEAGFGRGLGLLDLAAWEASPEAQEWEVAPVGEDLNEQMVRGRAEHEFWA